MKEFHLAESLSNYRKDCKNSDYLMTLAEAKGKVMANITRFYPVQTCSQRFTPPQKVLSMNKIFNKSILKENFFNSVCIKFFDEI